MNTRFFPAFALAMAAVVLLSNLLVQYPINPWLTWGAFSYPVAYFVTDVCNRIAGPSAARRVVWIGFSVGIILSVIFAPVRIGIASGTAFLVSQLLDVSIFNQLRRQSWWKAPFFGSSVASVVDTAIFFSLAFAGTEHNWVQLGTGDLAAKLFMAVALLPPYRVVINRLAVAKTP